MGSKKIVDAEETKREKARQLRYKKPIVKDLNLDSIMDALDEISEACYDVQYYIDGDDDTLLNALDGDKDDAYEFKVMFSDLCAECEEMQEDLRNEYLPKYFDLFFAAVGRGQELIGYDVYEHDYYGLSRFEGDLAKEEAVKKMKMLTKHQLIEAAQYCFGVYQAYIGLQHRYDCIRAALDILRDENTGYLKMVKQIDELYTKVYEETEGFRWTHGMQPALREFDRMLESLPQEAWLQ